MTDSSSSNAFREYWPLWLTAIILAAGAQLSVAVTGQGIPPWNPLLTLRTGMARVNHEQPDPGVRLPALHPFLIWWVIFVVLSVLIWIAAWIAFRRLVGDRGGDGFAGARQIKRRVGRGALTKGMTAYAKLGGTWIRARAEDVAAVFAPPRMGKTARVVVRQVLGASGAVAVTGTKPDIVRLTIKARAKLGDVYVVDPEGVTGWPTKAHWNMVEGCENDRKASERAKAIVAARPLNDGGGNIRFFAEAADTVMRCLLHAAALGGLTMREVVAWARDFTDDTPYDILATHPDASPGWVDDLRKYCRAASPETVASTDMTMGIALKAFGIRSVLEAACPAEGALMIDAEKFWASTDTLYLMTESGDNSLAAPLITALLSTLEAAARRASTRTASGRLEPPLTLMLEECANVAPIPQLPSLMTDGGGRGVHTWAIFQSRSQVERRWGKDGAKEIIEGAAVMLVLGGGRDTDFLEDMSKLIGERETTRFSSTTSGVGISETASLTKERTMPLAEIRQIPEGGAVLLYREQAPAVVRLPGWWETGEKATCNESLKWSLEQEGIRA